MPVPERIPLPTLSPPPARRSVPLVALVAPLGIALVLWLVMGSPYALLFALMGPVVAGVTALEARRTARRTRREELDRLRRELRQLEAELDERLAQRRAALARAAPDPRALSLDDTLTAWRLGRGVVPTGIELVASEEIPELDEEIGRLRAHAAQLRDAPVLVADADTLVVSGAEPLVHALARGLVLQAVARCAPGTAHVVVPPGEAWARELPARCTEGPSWSVESAGERVLALPAAGTGRGLEVRLGEAGEEARLGTEQAGWHPGYLARAEAARLARQLGEAAVHRGWRPPGAIPSAVGLEELLAESDAAPTAAVLGRDAAGPVHVDLEQDGPHALVAGTTGSGKSELLVSWVLALAARRPPAELAFLLVDFKGGSSFAPLLPLPHVAGVVSDLDEATATRAVESLRAELRRREAELARHGVRDIAELAAGALPRLVIVVDEFAALVALDPELQAVFADLAARGRSLGLHLVLGTQRPAGVVRDAVLANITVRVCLRVLEPGESTAMVGVPDAALIPGEQRGRGMLRDGSAAREVQFARAAPDMARRLAERWRGHPIPEARPWVDPLPAELALDELPPAAGGCVVGLVDVPEQQRREPLVVDPWAGALLVLGATGAGRSTALAALAAAAADGGAELRWVPPDAAELWSALLAPPVRPRALVVVDDLDLVLARGDAEQRAELTELLGRAVREGRRTGIALAASARSSRGAMQGAANAFEQRLLLRLASREEHLLNGGEARAFRAERRPGAADWRGREAQLALAPAPAPWRAPVPEAILGEGAWALATPRPEHWIARLGEAGIPASAPDHVAGAAGVRVADVDGWMLDHLALTQTRRTGRLLLHGCTRAELRTLVRARSAVPPLSDTRDDEAWLVEGSEIRRVRVRLDASSVQASPSGDSSASSP